jgi:alanyl-tRNA synthetase
VSQAKQLDKGLYVFTVDSENKKVAHANFVPSSLKTKGGDARAWASKVTEILGGKVLFKFGVT